jgi:tetratricopeptide (TPR) repeat protein
VRGALPVLVMALSAAAIGLVRPTLAQSFHGLRVVNDVYGLPAPEQTVVASLGYRAALADMLYAHVLVDYGLHISERRAYEFVGSYLETINALDPQFRNPYLLADTLLTMQAVPASMENYRAARRILERGMRERPFDTQLWTQAGQFLAYLAPAHIKDEATRKEWRMAGARALAHGCEIVSHDANLPYHCIGAAGILSEAGETEAMVSWLERVVMVNDDEEIHRLALGYLKATLGEREQQKIRERIQRFQQARRTDLDFLSKDSLLVLGPGFDPARCAGLGAAGSPKCATTWRDWSERQRRADAAPQ